MRLNKEKGRSITSSPAPVVSPACLPFDSRLKKPTPAFERLCVSQISASNLSSLAPLLLLSTTLASLRLANTFP
jgi:hypothetical protein